MERLEATDLGFLYFLAHLRRPWLTEAARAVTLLGSFIPLFPVVVLAALAFALARRWRFAWLVLAMCKTQSILMPSSMKFAATPSL